MNETQDLGIAEIHAPDVNWRMPLAIVASPGRLAEPHSVVTVRNNDLEGRKHILIDRHQQPIPLLPGQRKGGIEMLDREIENFRRAAMPRVMGGTAYPPHPLVFEDVRSPAPLPEPEPVRRKAS